MCSLFSLSGPDRHVLCGLKKSLHISWSRFQINLCKSNKHSGQLFWMTICALYKYDIPISETLDHIYTLPRFLHACSPLWPWYYVYGDMQNQISLFQVNVISWIWSVDINALTVWLSTCYIYMLMKHLRLRLCLRALWADLPFFLCHNHSTVV